MAHRRSFGRGRGISQAQRRKKTWIQVKQLVLAGGNPGFVTGVAIELSSAGVAGAGSRAGFFGLSGDGTAGNPFESTIPAESTILRIRGSLLFPKYFNAGNSDAGNIDVAIGYGVTSISDLNSSSYPAPITDAEWDGWMFRRQGPVGPVDSAGTIVDVKAMRKVESGDVFFVMAETVNGLGNVTPASFLWQLDLRLLVLLP